jgi:hypothetical protein
VAGSDEDEEDEDEDDDEDGPSAAVGQRKKPISDAEVLKQFYFTVSYSLLVYIWIPLMMAGTGR